jgi:hypothetical protein
MSISLEVFVSVNGFGQIRRSWRSGCYSLSSIPQTCVPVFGYSGMPLSRWNTPQLDAQADFVMHVGMTTEKSRRHDYTYCIKQEIFCIIMILCDNEIMLK